MTTDQGASVHELHPDGPPALKSVTEKFPAGYVNLGFLQDAGQSILKGWTATRPLDPKEYLPEPINRRVFEMLRRHVSGLGNVGIELEEEVGWQVCFHASDPRQRQFSYVFSLLH